SATSSFILLLHFLSSFLIIAPATTYLYTLSLHDALPIFFTSHSAQEPITGQILPGVFFSLVPVGQAANFIQHAHNTQESMVLLRPDAIRIKNFQDAARFSPRIAILPLFPFHQLADLHSLLNISSFRLTFKLPDAGQYKDAAFAAHVTKRGPDRIINNTRLHITVTMLTLH